MEICGPLLLQLYESSPIGDSASSEQQHVEEHINPHRTLIRCSKDLQQ